MRIFFCAPKLQKEKRRKKIKFRKEDKTQDKTLSLVEKNVVAKKKFCGLITKTQHSVINDSETIDHLGKHDEIDHTSCEKFEDETKITLKMVFEYDMKGACTSANETRSNVHNGKNTGRQKVAQVSQQYTNQCEGKICWGMRDKSQFRHHQGNQPSELSSVFHIENLYDLCTRDHAEIESSEKSNSCMKGMDAPSLVGSDCDGDNSVTGDYIFEESGEYAVMGIFQTSDVTSTIDKESRLTSDAESKLDDCLKDQNCGFNVKKSMALASSRKTALILKCEARSHKRKQLRVMIIFSLSTCVLLITFFVTNVWSLIVYK